MVATKRDDARQGLALDCGAPLVRICRGRAREDLEMAVLNLLEGPSVVVSSSLSVLGVSAKRNATHDVTGISPQSSTVAQLLKGLVLRGTLYPPLSSWLALPGFLGRIIRFLTRDSTGASLVGYPKAQSERLGGTMFQCRMGHR